MAPLTPYIYIQCPCSDPSTVSQSADTTPSHEGGQDEDDRAFDPRAPRSNYSLYPLEYLLYCEDCHQIRCPRCVAEEIAAYYCPNCLFEVPFSNIRSEGNRCTRSCFQCPICTSPLTVNSLDAAPNPSLLTAGSSSAPSGPYILTCSYCNWSSEEVGIKFEKPNGIATQLARVRNGGQPRLTAKERRERRREDTTAAAAIAEEPPSPSPPTDDQFDFETHFANLLTFYKSQLAESSPGSAAALGVLSPLGGADLGFSSPGSLSRIMSLYSGTSTLHDRRSGKTPRAAPMREARDADEGLRLAQLDERAAVAVLRDGGWDITATAAQAAAQLPVSGCEPVVGGGTGGGARFVDALRPVPYLLRAKRSKRCPVCRHIISKPESKVSSTRFRIRLVAGSYIPSIVIRPLDRVPGQGGANIAAAGPDLLAPLQPVQYLLTFKNPIFDPVKVTLATPATTPGRFPSKVTLLCPQFDIGANTDAWDDALQDGGGGGSGTAGHYQAEAGKIWERGRNWVSIVVEVVPASLRTDGLALTRGENGKGARGENGHISLLREDEDILEIPMFVRLEWESEMGNDEVGSAPGEKDKDAKIRRELAYWCVLGIGRIAQS